MCIFQFSLIGKLVPYPSSAIIVTGRLISPVSALLQIDFNQSLTTSESASFTSNFESNGSIIGTLGSSPLAVCLTLIISAESSIVLFNTYKSGPVKDTRTTNVPSPFWSGKIISSMLFDLSGILRIVVFKLPIATAEFSSKTFLSSSLYSCSFILIQLHITTV